MSINDNETYKNTPITADTLINTGQGTIGRIFVASATSGTITVYDNTSATGTKIVDTFSVTAATSYPFQTFYKTGLFIDIGGTVSATVFWT